QLAQVPQHGESVHPGQAHVQDQQVEFAAARVVQCGDPVGDDRGRVTAGGETAGDEAGDAGFVRCDEDPHDGLRGGAGGWGGCGKDGGPAVVVGIPVVLDGGLAGSVGGLAALDGATAAPGGGIAGTGGTGR